MVKCSSSDKDKYIVMQQQWINMQGVPQWRKIHHNSYVSGYSSTITSLNRKNWFYKFTLMVNKKIMYIWDHFREKGPNACFFKIQFFYTLEVWNVLYTLLLTHWELECLSWSCFLITFQRKSYISFARTGNFIVYVFGSISRKRSHMPNYSSARKSNPWPLIILTINNSAMELLIKLRLQSYLSN